MLELKMCTTTLGNKCCFYFILYIGSSNDDFCQQFKNTHQPHEQRGNTQCQEWWSTSLISTSAWQRQERRISEFEASLVDRVSSRTVRETTEKPCLVGNNKTWFCTLGHQTLRSIKSTLVLRLSLLFHFPIMTYFLYHFAFFFLRPWVII